MKRHPYFREQTIIFYELKDVLTGKVLQREASIGMLHYWASHEGYQQPCWICDGQGRILERCAGGVFHKWDSETKQYVEVSA